ncbi:MAG TPA: hypothetical protein VIM12_04430 [Noviherbaspirillum sp.]|jgi:hypothetical protein|uniref:hypothetical protein n=1 Tax=Noviherbaspirillum sp. TaxID=1926288 RepID=UPI002F926554
MWKIFAAFVVFAAVALFVIMKAGDKVDMQGEAGHGLPTDSATHSTPETPSTPAAPAGQAVPAAPAGTEPAPAK